MTDPTFRTTQWNHRYADHIAPINHLVDDLRKDPLRGWAPYVPPMYGGIHARLLSILRDPGPKTQDGTGSGFICMENDDPTAEAICNHFAAVQIDARDIVPWNAYPWYINRAPDAAEMTAGLEPLRRLIDLLPNLRVVMLHGGHAKTAWKKFERSYPDIVARRRLAVIPTYHTSRQAFWHRDVAVREARKEHLREAFERAAGWLNGAKAG